MNAEQAKAEMTKLADAAKRTPNEVGKPMGATFMAPNGNRFQVYFSGGERWHVNGTRKSKSKALLAMTGAQA